MDEAHEGGECLLATQGDTAEALELVEEALDLMAFFVEAPVDQWLGGATWIGLDLRGGPEVVGDEGAERIGVVGGIGDDVADALETGQKGFGLRAVTMLPGRGMDADRQADGVDGGMQLSCQAATGATYRGSFSPPFAPVASA